LRCSSSPRVAAVVERGRPEETLNSPARGCSVLSGMPAAAAARPLGGACDAASCVVVWCAQERTRVIDGDGSEEQTELSSLKPRAR
jgi:hypothetical protein